MTIEKKAIPILMTGVLILALFTAVNAMRDMPHWVTVCAVIFGSIFVLCGVFIVAKSKMKKQ